MADAGLVVFTWLLRVTLTAWPGKGLPTFITFYPAVMVVALLGGVWPGLLATSLCAAIADHLLLPPGSSLLIASLKDTMGLALFATMGVFLTAIAELYRRARVRAAESERKAAIGNACTALKEDRQREHALLTAVAANTDVMLVYLDPDFNFVWVNQAYADTCHMSPQDMVGKNHFALYPHAENEAIFHKVRDFGEPIFFKDKPFEFPDQLERGVTYWDWSLTPIKNREDEVIGLIFSLRETTSYVRVEMAARENEDWLRAFVDGAPAGIAMFDRQMRHLMVSRRFLEDYGLKASEVIGRSHYEVFPELPERWREAHRRCLAGETLRCDEDTFLRADGRAHCGRWEIWPWFAASA